MAWARVHGPARSEASQVASSVAKTRLALIQNAASASDGANCWLASYRGKAIRVVLYDETLAELRRHYPRRADFEFELEQVVLVKLRCAETGMGGQITGNRMTVSLHDFSLGTRR